MKFTHFIDAALIESIKKNGITVGNCYRGVGILVYPDVELNFRIDFSDSNLIEESKRLNELPQDDKWQVIAALGLRQNQKKVVGVKLNLSNSHWPIKVFIDIDSSIAVQFAEALDKRNSKGIKYLSETSLSEVVRNIDSHRYVLEGEFTVNTEQDLLNLTSCFLKSGGGIHSAHSFDCMVNSTINPNLILEYKEYT